MTNNNTQENDYMPTPQEFATLLSKNEEDMGEHAAFALTCSMLGIEEDEGYDLLMEADYE